MPVKTQPTSQDKLEEHSWRDNRLCISQNNHRPRVGQLLVAADLISTKILSECIDESKRSHQKLGDVLVESGAVERNAVKCALLVQTFISDGVVGERTAVRLLAHAVSTKEDLNQLVKEQTLRLEHTESDRLGLAEFLIDANLTTANSIEKAKQRSAASGILLGRALLLMNALTAEALDSALFVLGMVRAGEINKAEAMRFLKKNAGSKTSLSGNFAIPRFVLKRKQRNISLGKLCISGNLLNEFECLSAIEKSFTEECKLGEILIAEGLVADKSLRMALLLQGLAQIGVLKPEQASLALKKLHADSSLSFFKVAQQTRLFEADSPDEQSALFLLRAASIIDLSAIKEAHAEFSTYDMCPIKALLSSRRLSVNTYKHCLTTIEEIKNKRLTIRSAVEILRVCHQTGCDYAEASIHVNSTAASLCQQSCQQAAQSEAQEDCPKSEETGFKFRNAIQSFCKSLNLLNLVQARRLSEKETKEK